MPRTNALPAGPSAHPIEQLVRLVNEPFEFIGDCARELGPIFTLRIFGQEPWVILGDSEAARTAFRASADELHSGSDAMKYLLGDRALIFLDGESHRRERRILTPPFKHERMAVYGERMLARANDAIDGLESGETIEALPFVKDLALGVIVECVFGLEDPDSRDRFAALFARHLASMETGLMGALAMALGGERFREWIRRGTALYHARARTAGPLPASRNPMSRFFATKAELDSMMKLELERCRHDPGDRDDVLAMLARATYEDGASMSDEHLLDELFTLLVAGHDTTAITIAWTLYLLHENGAALELARAELDEVFGDGPITPHAVERLRYLSAAIEEAMRMRPIATGVVRRLTEPKVIGNHTLPAGTLVLPSPAILHFREDLWDEPHAFRPERFLGQKPSPFHYMPFGGGSRACLGRPFAMVEMRLVLAQVLRRLDLSLLPSTSPKAQLHGLFVAPSAVPLRVDRVRPRDGLRADTRSAPRHMPV